MRNSAELTRREFIVKSVTAISAVYIIPDLIPKAVAAKPLDLEVSAKTKWAINVDVNKCVDGCTACVEACVDENGLYGFDRPETDSQWIRKLRIKDIKTDKEILDYIRNNGGTVYHAIGSCRMGIDNNAVVNSELKVNGIQSLRIADASIMPTMPSGNTNAATMMIAEKASDLIKKEM